MAHGALGTDTGGSCRIPAAFNGSRFQADRSAACARWRYRYRLARHFGPLAQTVACCAALDAVLANRKHFVPFSRRYQGHAAAVPTTVALDDLDDALARPRARLAALLTPGA